MDQDHVKVTTEGRSPLCEVAKALTEGVWLSSEDGRGPARPLSEGMNTGVLGGRTQRP